MSKAKGKPAVPLGDRLADAIATLRAMTAGDMPKDNRRIKGPMIAYLDGQAATKGPRARPDHPIGGQLAEIEAIVASDETLRRRWDGYRQEHRSTNALGHWLGKPKDLGIDGERF